MSILTIRSREIARSLLNDDETWERLKELSQNSQTEIGSYFSTAFAHLLSMSGSVELFVETQYRHLYSELHPAVTPPNWISTTYPLQGLVIKLCGQMQPGTFPIKSPEFDTALPLYMKLLSLVLKEGTDVPGKLATWLKEVRDTYMDPNRAHPSFSALSAA
ncbi:hypothetical protein FRB90_000793 [Tulasnella sp. 427]|nr:hypothetical protein FRB90_000793 [Tulasnella sp. 427]